MKLLIALLLVTSTLAIVPTASACAPLANCIPDKEVCYPEHPAKCVGTREVVEWVADLFGPCTCPPIL